MNLLPLLHKSSRAARSRCAVLLLTTLAALATPAPGVDLRSQGAPIVTGTGAATTARWNNVGTVDGQSIDLFARIAAHTGQAKYVFATDTDDFKFQFVDGTPGENRTATVIWTFYKSGTNNPVTVSNLAFTIDDLDDSSRHESLSTTDAYDFTVNSPTKIAAVKAGSFISASGAGGVSHNPGEPEGAVKLLFSDKSTLVINYATEFDGADKSAFHHDGDGDFTFDDPDVHVLYTYHFANSGENKMAVDFFDSLPEGLIWDTGFGPEVSGELNGIDVIYSNGNRDAYIHKLNVHPGSGTLTLRTVKTSVRGTIVNEATITPDKPESNNNESKNMSASSTISLPDHE